MSRRLPHSLGALAAVLAAMSLPAVSVAGQAPAPAATRAAAKPAAAPARPYVQPKTPWGDPDLQGIWNDATSTPLQRPARLGDTRGHWEGNTLVVETTNFRDDPGVTYQNTDAGTFTIIERFTRVGPDRINYEYTVSDPKTWTKPWKAMIPWNKTDDQIYEY